MFNIFMKIIISLNVLNKQISSTFQIINLLNIIEFIYYLYSNYTIIFSETYVSY